MNLRMLPPDGVFTCQIVFKASWSSTKTPVAATASVGMAYAGPGQAVVTGDAIQRHAGRKRNRLIRTRTDGRRLIDRGRRVEHPLRNDLNRLAWIRPRQPGRRKLAVAGADPAYSLP